MAPAGYDDDPSGASDGPADDSSLFDELFVAGAQYREETAAERAARADEERREQRRRDQQEKRQRVASRLGGRRRALAFGLLAVAVLITWRLGWGTRPSGQAEESKEAEAADPLPTAFVVTHAVPADVQSSPLALETIRAELDITSRWLASQTGGRTLRFIEESGKVAIDERRLSISSTALAGRTDAAAALKEELSIGDRAHAIRLVFAPVRFADQRCGETSGRQLVIIWTGSCGVEPLAPVKVFGDGTTATIAHEAMHALGAVEPCAPHHGGNGHVVDDRTDLLYDGPDPAPEPERVLDPGRDDYFDHHNDGCWDVAKHPAWRQ
jgi:hypothetical protein